MSETVYITTPIYYVNDVPHLGHAYTTVAADVLARYYRSLGRSVHFVTGTDEHGQKIETAAQARGEKPIEMADRVVEAFRSLWKTLNISHDDFIRTTEARHERVVQELWRRLEAAGDIYLGAYEGLYCTGCEAYKTERELTDGCCEIHKTPVDVLKEPSYFFRLDRHREALLQALEQRPELILPEARRNKIKADLAQPVGDLSISRTSFSWGVPVPEDKAHVMYVWLDALTNYISALGWPDGELMQRFWGEQSRVIHLIGKDILWFHTVYWPSFLMSAGVPLPTTVFAHGWWTVEGHKMSKSLGNWVDPGPVVATYGVDAFRYFLLREVPFGIDGDFSKAALVGRINADLANDLGNLANRTLSMTERFCGGVVPPTTSDHGHEELQQTLARVEEQMHRVEPHKALETIWTFVRSRNRYIDERAPWAAHKAGNAQHRDDTLHNTLEALRWLSAVLAPFMPEKCDELAQKLALEAAPALTELGAWGETLAGRSVATGAPLFPRLELPAADEEKASSSAPAAADGTKKTGKSEVETVKTAEISYEQFMDVDLRVGLVEQAEEVPKTRNLLKLLVDVGEPEPRTIVSGIKQCYRPEDLVGKRIVVVTNLAPRKIRGVLSQGMLLAAGEADDLVLSELGGDIAPGTRVR